MHQVDLLLIGLYVEAIKGALHKVTEHNDAAGVCRARGNTRNTIRRMMQDLTFLLRAYLNRLFVLYENCCSEVTINLPEMMSSLVKTSQGLVCLIT